MHDVQASHSIIRSTAEPIFAEYIGKFKIESIEFENLSLGNLPPIIHGLKVFETNERELVMEPAFKWAGNPNIIVTLTISSVQVTVQLVDLQVFATPLITLKPLVHTIPCFANIVVSLLEKVSKLFSRLNLPFFPYSSVNWRNLLFSLNHLLFVQPHIDFGIKVLGGDIMSIPGLYQYIQDIIQKEVANLYLWPKSLEISVLDASTVSIKKPVGILRVKVVRATKLLKMDLLGLSDPYVKLRLGGEKLPSKKTTIKKKTLNPEWNEEFKLSVKDPLSQVLHIDVFDWDKVGAHDLLGSQLVPLKLLTPNETKELVLDLLKNTSINDPQNKKQRGQITLELTYAPFRNDLESFSGCLDGMARNDSILNRASSSVSPKGAGLLLLTVQGAQDVEGSRHNNPYVLVIFRGERKKSKMIRRTRNPMWNEEFHFILEEPPSQDKIQIKVMSKRTVVGFKSKESLGHVDIDLGDVVHNGRINHKYHLIDSKNGVIHVDARWKII
ncbi:synaptotagmin-3-like isoform X1 [Olea europaea subsp. europaea]|uniref:Synaptotagmin-3-like isoform X1 n=1 Tax=Olea europaea subsp. europaea TaxID=158383 RepID=A0A8S0SGC2_OLEEU|nr:synaptotagmin-3-like isoform X1 [Olea europaea subsp. europaea]